MSAVVVSIDNSRLFDGPPLIVQGTSAHHLNVEFNGLMGNSPLTDLSGPVNFEGGSLQNLFMPQDAAALHEYTFSLDGGTLISSSWQQFSVNSLGGKALSFCSIQKCQEPSTRAEPEVEDVFDALREPSCHELLQLQKELELESIEQEKSNNQEQYSSATFEERKRARHRTLGQEDCLSYSEEVALSRVIKLGLKDSATETEKISAEEAVHRLCVSNLRQIKIVARGLVGRPDFNGVFNLDDCESEGYLGMMQSARKFDPDAYPGVCFAAYAYWGIRQAIIRAIGNQSRTIRIPYHEGQTAETARRIEEDLEFALKRKPSDQEIADQLNNHYAKSIANKNRKFYEPKDVQEMRANPVAFSGDKTLGDDKDAEPFWSALPDEDSPEVFQDLLSEDWRRDINEALGILTERQRYVIGQRVGLTASGQEQEPRFLEDIGNELGVSKQRVSQIEVEALKKLRGWFAERKLSDFDY